MQPFVRRPAAVMSLSCVLVAFASCGTDDVHIADPDPDASAPLDGGPGPGPGPIAEDGSTPDADAGPDGSTPTVYGLDARPTNATCKAFTAPPTTGEAQFVSRFPNVTFNRPTAMFQRPGDNSRWYVTERGGRVLYFPNDPAATAADVKTALDLRSVTWNDWDCSMSGVAFPPDFATSKRAYVAYCYMFPNTNNKNLQVRISRFTVPDGQTFDPASEQVVLAFDHPGDVAHGSTIGLHTSDAMRFGKDGFLYATIGDGGPQGKIGGTQAQDPNDLRGKLLRIDVSELDRHIDPVDFVENRRQIEAKFPADNPFVAGGGHPAVYAYGFRNPWQWHFDRLTGKIWLGDVGNSTWEEIDRDVKKGGNYGWGVLEGFACTNQGPGACTNPALLPPLLAYRHGVAGPITDPNQTGRAVSGGIVYRGSAVPSLKGAYVFGDSSTGRLWTVKNVDAIPDPVPTGTEITKTLFQENVFVASFAEDQDGEMYAVNIGSGKILALEEKAAVPDPSLGGPPALLSQTGCVDATDPKKPAAGLVPYAPSAELWSDGAVKKRWFAIPDGKQIAVAADGDFDFPKGSVLVKEFSVGAQRVETRFFVRQDADDHWAGYTYQWKEDQSDATLVPRGGSQLVAGGQVWSLPSRAQCLRCHTTIAGTTLGLELAQLNHEIAYAGTGRTANQVATLAHVGLLGALPAGPFANLAPVGDEARTVTDRARAYLHSNCANCHRPDGPTFTPLDLRHGTPLAQMGICNAAPTIDDLLDFIPTDPRLLAAGDPTRSVLYWRLFTEDTRVRMPPIARSMTHIAGSAVVSAWITDTKVCP